MDKWVTNQYIVCMRKNDARLLPPASQEALRRRAVDAVNAGMSQTQAAKVFGVSRSSVAKWISLYRRGGDKALTIKKRGRPSRKMLEPWQSAQVVRTVVNRCPDQVQMPWALWTADIVRQYIINHFGVSISRTTVNRYLNDWGLTPQKPAKRALEQSSEAVKQWLETDYPTIRAEAKSESAEIHWGDECGFRSDHQTGTTWGRKGKTPVVASTGKRFSLNMISTITNYGTLRFMVFDGRFTSDVFINFLRRLIKSTDRKVFLIVDNLSVHKSKKVRDWVAGQAKWLRIFYLPTYSPELNPDEYLNNDVKSNGLGRKRAKNKEELAKNVRRHLRSTQRKPAKVRGFFRAKPVLYAQN